MSSERPAFIIAFAADMQGCGQHRIAIPLASLVEAGLADGRIDMAVWPIEIAAAAAPDTIVWQRQVEDSQIELMQKYREAMPDTLFIYELDDYLGEIPKASFHAGFMPPDLPKKVAAAISLCDRVTTSTQPLADWLASLSDQKLDIRVVGNALPVARLMPKERQANTKLRVGFAGGISHEGDLEILRQAMTNIGDEVQWVFMGMKPKNPPVQVEFHEGVQPVAYLDELAKLNIDLMLAPLEDNRFNHCKSNLRLLEAATIGAAVIAQNLTPYTDGYPPVFAYAVTPADWEQAIRAFISSKPAERAKSAEKLLQWVTRHHSLEGRLKDRAAAWLRDETPFRPQQHKKCMEPFVLACATPDGFLPGAARQAPTLLEACSKAISLGSDVLWLRPGTRLDQRAWDAMRVALIEDNTVASVVPIATDGANAFPKLNGWTAVSDQAADVIGDALAEVMRNRLLTQPSSSGPAILMSKAALAMGGAPDVEGCDGNEEVAIMEWGLRLALRGWKHFQATGAFAVSFSPPMPPTPKVGQRFQTRAFMMNVKQPSESLSPADRAAIEYKLLRRQWNGMRPGSAGFGADYPSWAALREATKPRVLPASEAKSRLFISRYNEDLEGLKQLIGSYEWVMFTDENITLKPWARDVLERELSGIDPSVNVVYADHETRIGDQLFPEFKAGFDIEMFLARDYITPACAVRVSWLKAMPVSKSDLYDSLLMEGLLRGSYSFRNIADVLVTVEGMTSPEESALEALARQLSVREQLGDKVKVTAHKGLVGCLTVKRNWKAYQREFAGNTEAPLISIIIPTLGGGRLLQPCINTLLQHTKYPNFEVIIVQNGSRQEPELGEAANDPRVKWVYWKTPISGFNWSEINNWTVREHAKGTFLCFMNDDVCVSSMEGDWLDLMLGHAIQADVGVVGARLIHPMGIVQHVGVVAHKGIAGHLHKGLPNGHPGVGGMALLTHEAAAVTGACMMCSREKYDLVKGFDESFSLNYNDTDFCLRLGQHKLRNIVEMGAELLHPEGTSRNGPDQMQVLMQLQKDNLHFAERWPQEDPYWSPNLALGFVQNGMAIQGLNADMLAWEDTLPDPMAKRVLIINDNPGVDGRALVEMRRGAIPFLADASSFNIQMVAPTPLNMPAWNIRKPAEFKAALNALGIDLIIVRSLVGHIAAAPPVDLLRYLAGTGIKVEIAPITPGVVMPWVNPDWEPDSEPFGYVDVDAWKAALAALGAPSMPVFEDVSDKEAA